MTAAVASEVTRLLLVTTRLGAAIVARGDVTIVHYFLSRSPSIHFCYLRILSCQWSELLILSSIPEDYLSNSPSNPVKRVVKRSATEVES